MTQKTVLTLNPISPVAGEVLEGYKLTTDYQTTHSEAVIEYPVGVLVRSFNMENYELPKSVLAVARAGAGYNNIPHVRYANEGVCVFNTPGANANGVKELVLAALLIASRNIIPATEWATTLHGDVAKQVEKGKGAFAGTEIAGKTICVLGLGAIGKLVAISAHALGMSVVGYDPFVSEATKAELNFVTIFDDLSSACHNADFVTVHIPMTPATKDILSAELIEDMKDGVIIINLARGELANVNAIKQGLAKKKIRAYVTDFPTEEILGVEGVIAIPHLGASTQESEDNCAKMAAEQLKNYIENGNIVNSVNMPNLSLPKRAAHRVSIISLDSGSNTYGGASATRGGIRYTLINTDEMPDMSIYTEGVIKARLIY